MAKMYKAKRLELHTNLSKTVMYMNIETVNEKRMRRHKFSSFL